MTEIVPLKRKRRPVPIPESATKIIGLMFGVDALPGTLVNVHFRLARCQQGVKVVLFVPGFSWDLSSMEGRWPSSFAEARAWVAAYAARYGQIFEEDAEPRRKGPTGADRKLLKAGGCKESWLASDIDALFGAAALRCQHAGAFCMQDGYCHLGGCDMEYDAPATLPA